MRIDQFVKAASAALVILGVSWLLTPHGQARSAQVESVVVNYGDLGHRVQIIGRFGLPIGSLVTVEGRRTSAGARPTKGGAGNLVVEKVNGKVLAQPVGLWVSHIASLPAGTRCVLKGYETGAMVGTPADVLRRIKGPAPQLAWQFVVHFVVVEVIKPPSRSP